MLVLRLSTLTGFNVDHSSFTPVCLVHLHVTIFSKKLSFKRSRTRLGHYFFRNLCPKVWSVSQIFLNSLTMIILNILFFELLYGMNLNWFWFPFLYDFEFDCMLWSANCVKFVVLFYEFYEIIFLLYVYILLEILYSSFS